MKKRKFADGGETDDSYAGEIAKGRSRFSEDTYKKAREQVEGGGVKEVIKTAAKKARKVETDPTAGEAKDKAAQRAADRMESAEPAPKKNAAGIPIDPDAYPAPASTGEDTSGPSNFGRVASALGAGAGAAGVAAAMRTAGHAARMEKAAKSMAATRAATNTPGAARLAEAAKRSKDASDARLPGEVMDILNRPMKKGGSVAKYAKGGSIDGIAQRGKTRGKMC